MNSLPETTIKKLLREVDDAEEILKTLQFQYQFTRQQALAMVKRYISNYYCCPLSMVRTLRIFGESEENILFHLRRRFHLDGVNTEACMAEHRQIILIRRAGIAPQFI